jgi:hypothetical protein
VSVCQFQDGSCLRYSWSQDTVIGKGLAVVTPLVLVVVPARPLRLAPGSSPYHSFFPSVLVGPAQICSITRASVTV